MVWEREEVGRVGAEEGGRACSTVERLSSSCVTPV